MKHNECKLDGELRPRGTAIKNSRLVDDRIPMHIYQRVQTSFGGSGDVNLSSPPQHLGVSQFFKHHSRRNLDLLSGWYETTA